MRFFTGQGSGLGILLCSVSALRTDYSCLQTMSSYRAFYFILSLSCPIRIMYVVNSLVNII